MKIGLLILHAVCVCEPPPQLTFECLNQSLSGVLHGPLPSVYLAYVCMCIPPIAARLSLGKRIPVTTDTRNNRIVGRVCLCASLCILQSLLGKTR
jgi:hypothetical protein